MDAPKDFGLVQVSTASTYVSDCHIAHNKFGSNKQTISKSPIFIYYHRATKLYLPDTDRQTHHKTPSSDTHDTNTVRKLRPNFCHQKDCLKNSQFILSHEKY